MPASPPPRPTPAAKPEERAIDLLSDILGVLRLQGEVLCWTQLTAPWGLRFAPDEAFFFHIVERGTCWLQLSESREPLRVSGGDLVVVPHGRGHRLFDSPKSRTVPVMRLVDPAKGLPGRLRYGGGGVETLVVCGRFRFDERLRLGMLPGLPSVIHVPGSGGRSPEWLDLTLRFLTAEAQNNEPGRELAMSRLVDLLFIQTMRHWLATNGEPPLGLGALRDPRIGAALGRIHSRPDRPWDVETLAAEAGMSRSSFADRFVEIVGEPPGKYLARWRFHFAARLLRAPGVTIAQTAERVGYESEGAFSRAFKRHIGVSPAVFRAENRAKGRPRGKAR